MVRVRDTLLVPLLGAALAAGAAVHRTLVGPRAALDLLASPAGAALLAGLTVGALTVGLHSRSRLGAGLGGTAGSTLAAAHAAVAETAGLVDYPILITGGLASGLAAYLGYRAILPPEGESEGEGEGGEA